MKKILSLALALTMLLALFGCAKEPDAPESSTPETPESNDSEDYVQGETVACCMGNVNHPVHRVVQYGFCTKAQELGMNPIVSGLDEGNMQELIDKWNSDIASNNAVGAMIWTGDDSCYEMMKELKQQGVYTVVSHFVHSYYDTKMFIDKDMASIGYSYGDDIADSIIEFLTEKGITEGSIGVIQVGQGDSNANGANNAFRIRIAEGESNFTVLETLLTGMDEVEAASKITDYIMENPDMVAVVSVSDITTVYWAEGIKNTNREDIVFIGTGSSEMHISLLDNNTIEGLVYAPLHEEGRESANALYELINGAVFNTSESEWFSELEAHIAYVGGEGKNDIQTYRDIYNTAQEYFKE